MRQMHVSYLHLSRPHIETEQILIVFPIADSSKLRHEIHFPLCFTSDNTAHESPKAYLRASLALPAIYRSGNCCENGYTSYIEKCKTIYKTYTSLQFSRSST